MAYTGFEPQKQYNGKKTYILERGVSHINISIIPSTPVQI